MRGADPADFAPPLLRIQEKPPPPLAGWMLRLLVALLAAVSAADVGTMRTEFEHKRLALRRIDAQLGGKAFAPDKADPPGLYDRVAARQTKAKLEQVLPHYRSQLQTERVEVATQLDKAGQELARHQHRQQLLELRAPVEGTVKDLATHTAGTVAAPGTILMTLVPHDETLKRRSKTRVGRRVTPWFVVLGFAAIALAGAAAAADSRFPTVDSRALTDGANARFVWIDNEELLFVSATPNSEAKRSWEQVNYAIFCQ